MSEHNHNGRHNERLKELLADEQLGQLSSEDQADLEALREERGDGGSDYSIGELLLALDASDKDEGAPPARLVNDVAARGVGIVASDRSAVAGSIGSKPSKGGAVPWLIAAASVVLAAGGGVYGVSLLSERDEEIEAKTSQIAQLEMKVSDNEAVIASARAAQARLERSLADATEEADTYARRLADESAQRVELAEQLARATSDLEQTTSDLDEAQMRIAKLEAPEDPAVLAANRIKLLEVPDTVRLAWQPFDLPDSPAQVQGIEGDVVWNDELETGYLRFVGLPVNDPDLEQYQVWVIDERGMEQKVSGGVFNATAQGEVIVPIDPAIDVGRVALFAITVENAGGTWVPDLERRVVLAPRTEEG